MQTEMTKLKREQLISFHRRELRVLEANEPKCKNCERFGAGNMCHKWKAVPPDDVQAVGCPEWILEEVPF